MAGMWSFTAAAGSLGISVKIEMPTGHTLPQTVSALPSQGTEEPSNADPYFKVALALVFEDYLWPRDLRASGFTVVSSTGVVPCTSVENVAPAGTR
jgi:hypothetical protein